MPFNLMDLVLLFALSVMAFIYALPALRALNIQHPNMGAIFVINMTLGWTGIGWIVALVWSFTKRYGWQK